LSSTSASKDRTPKDGISKEILVGYYEPDRQLAQVVVKMKDAVGAVASIARIMAGLKIDVRQSTACSLPNHIATYNAFVELGSSSVSGEQLVRSLSKSTFVIDAKVIEGRHGAIIDTASFPVNWQGRRVVILAQPAIARMLEGVRHTFGSGGDVVLYQQGTDYGRDLAKFFLDMFGKEYLLKNYDYGLNILTSTGWGVPELMDDKFPGLTLRITSCFECAGVEGGRTLCSFTRGVLVGVFGSLAGSTVQCTETRCTGRGDPYCQFELQEWDGHSR
jgi:predicted hydrocarbon binding protein